MRRLFHAAVVTLGFMTSPVEAAVYDFSYATIKTSAGGKFTTTDLPDANGNYTITDITGKWNGSPIDSILDPHTWVGNDNLFNPSYPYFDQGGLSFTSGNININVRYRPYFKEFEEDTSNTQLDLLVFNIKSEPTLTASVPEPLSWMMMILGLGMIGMANRRSISGANVRYAVTGKIGVAG